MRFNHSTLEKQEEDIVRLKQELLEKDEQIKLIVEEYETVIRNFN